VNLGLEQQRRYCIIFIRKKKRFGSDGVEHFSERKKKKELGNQSEERRNI